MADDVEKSAETKGGGWLNEVIKGVFAVAAAGVAFVAGQRNGPEPPKPAATPQISQLPPIISNFDLLILKPNKKISVSECMLKLKEGIEHAGMPLSSEQMEQKFGILSLSYQTGATGYIACVPEKSAIMVGSQGFDDQAANTNQLKGLVTNSLDDYIRGVRSRATPYDRPIRPLDPRAGAGHRHDRAVRRSPDPRRGDQLWPVVVRL